MTYKYLTRFLTSASVSIATLSACGTKSGSSGTANGPAPDDAAATALTPSSTPEAPTPVPTDRDQAQFTHVVVANWQAANLPGTRTAQPISKQRSATTMHLGLVAEEAQWNAFTSASQLQDDNGKPVQIADVDWRSHVVVYATLDQPAFQLGADTWKVDAKGVGTLSFEFAPNDIARKGVPAVFVSVPREGIEEINLQLLPLDATGTPRALGKLPLP